jgi:uncharacterized protein YndB with AHSA1/START domain
MKRYELTKLVSASRETVWRVWSDAPGWPSWNPTVSRLEPLQSGLLEPGARYRIHQPRLATMVWTVVQLEPGVSFTWEATTVGLRTSGEHRIQCSDDSKQVTVQLVLRLDGWLAPLLGWASGPTILSNLKLEAESLATRSEAT